MAKLTKPTDLTKYVDQVDVIIDLVEQQFAKDRSFDTPSDLRSLPRKTIEIVGEFNASDRNEVARRYEKEDWANISHRVITRGENRVTSFTFIAKQ